MVNVKRTSVTKRHGRYEQICKNRRGLDYCYGWLIVVFDSVIALFPTIITGRYRAYPIESSWIYVKTIGSIERDRHGSSFSFHREVRFRENERSLLAFLHRSLPRVSRILVSLPSEILSSSWRASSISDTRQRWRTRGRFLESGGDTWIRVTRAWLEGRVRRDAGKSNCATRLERSRRLDATNNRATFYQ